MKRAVIVAILAVAAACGQKDAKATKDSSRTSGNTCDALAVSAMEARVLRDQVTAQFVSVGHAIDKAEQFDKKAVSAEQDGSGEYSGARQRAFSYMRTGFALCQAALLVDHGMLDLAGRELSSDDVRTAESQLPRVTCQLKARIDGAPESRAAATAEWSSQSRDAREFEDRLVQGCYDKSGTPRADVHLAAPVLPDE